MRCTISELYRQSSYLAPGDFERWALEQIKMVIPFDAALFASGNLQLNKFGSVSAINLPSNYVQTLTDKAAINPFLPVITQRPGKPTRVSDLLNADTFYTSTFYRTCFSEFGIERTLSTFMDGEEFGVANLVSLYRFDRKHEFNDEELAAQTELAYHLSASVSNNYCLHLRQRQTSQHHCIACIADSCGLVREAQNGFIGALNEKGLALPEGRLPFTIKPGHHCLKEYGLNVHISNFGDRFLVEIWHPTPLDELTRQERAAVEAAFQGLSDKEIALERGVAPATISSHLHRAYKKLGVINRREMRMLLEPHLCRGPLPGLAHTPLDQD